MCQVCDRLGIVIERPSEEQLAKEAAEEEALLRAKAQEWEQECLNLVAQGKPRPRRRKKLQPTARLVPRSKVVVEPAPSHDGASTFAAYEIPLSLLAADPESADGYSNSPPSQGLEELRPKFGIRIYDTTASATADRAALLARRISELTFDGRVSNDTHQQKDRIEVVALPLPESTTVKDRKAKCIAHNEAERRARLSIADAALAASWFMVENFYDRSRKQVFIITDLKDSWEDALPNTNGLGWSTRSGLGEFRIGFYDERFHYSDDEELDEEDMVPREGLDLKSLGAHLYEFRYNVRPFYMYHFIPDGVLDMELALARAEAAGIEVPRPVVIPLKRDAGWTNLDGWIMVEWGN
ncbi:hypothetical protein B0I37DRAFT_165312 [Chaetomium sp. MPI-CAGE-AT-0009]|nr:hypothetical protein B0I37DRAFT_165312 [Chaetomium sp. MPI-CAGE-AT-0009]